MNGELTQWRPISYPGASDHLLVDHAEATPLQRMLGVIRRRRLLIALCTVLVAAATVFFTLRMAPVFGASASVRIDDARGVGPLALMSGTMGERDLPTELEMLRSRSMAAAVIDSLDLQLALLHPSATSRSSLVEPVSIAPDALTARYRLERARDGRFELRDSMEAVLQIGAPGDLFTVNGASFRLQPSAADLAKIDVELMDRAEALERFERRLTVRQRGREARIVDIRYEDRDPELVVRVPNMLAALFIEDRQDVRQTEARSTAAFLREQIAAIAVQLAAAEDALRSFREDNRVISIAEQASAEVRQEAELRSQLAALRAESSALGALLEQVRSEAAVPGRDTSPYRNLVAFPTLLRNQTAGTLLGSLAEVEDRRTELLTRRSPEDSDVLNLTNRVGDLERQLEGIAQTYLSGLQSQMSSLDATLAATNREMAGIPAQEARFAQLQRDAVVLEQTYTQLQARLKEAEIEAAVEDPSMRLVDQAASPQEPLRPQPLVNFGLALIAGLFFGVAVAFGRERADRSVHSRRDVLRATGLPVLGFVPRADLGVRKREIPSRRNTTALQVRNRRIAGRKGYTLVSAVDGSTPFAEAYNRLDTNVAFAMHGQPGSVLVFTSPLPGEGKTMSAVNFALTLAQQGRNVLLIDGDLRRGVLHALFEIPRGPGLAAVLGDQLELQVAVQTVPLGSNGVLDVLSAGDCSGNPAHLMASERLGRLLSEMRGRYETVIIDAPPLNLVTDAALLGALADAVLIVARSGVTTGESLSFTIEQLRNVGANVLGSVLNDIDFKRDIGYDGSYRYYTHYKDYHVGV